MSIEAVYFDGGQRYSISIPSLVPFKKVVTIKKSPKMTFKRVLCLAGIVVLSISVLHQIDTSYSRVTKSKNIRSLSRFRPSQNAEKVKIWRSKILTACENAKTENEMASILAMTRENAFPISRPAFESRLMDPDYLPGNDIRICPYLFIDLGSGVGNSVEQFIDSGLVGCQRPEEFPSLSFDPMHFHIDGILQIASENRDDTSNREFKNWVQDRIQNFDPSFGPEDYCVYGLEGNPLLKSKLKRLENNIAKMNPSPLRHLHFLTQKVAGGDSKRPIFIDQAHAEDNFPGSSLFFNHLHVRMSKDQYGKISEYPVESLSLTSLMKRTLAYYNCGSVSEAQSDCNNEGDSRKKNHLIINIDVEGSEFKILNEAKDSGILCNLALDGNVVDIFVEYHSPEFLGIDSPNTLRYIHEVRPYFGAQCGDTLSFYETRRYF